MQEGSNKAIVAAFAANLGLAGAKLAGFFITGASSMLAEAVHSAADSANQGLLLLGISRAKKPATQEHPFGYARERYFWAFIVATVIFVLGGVFALYEGISKRNHPHAIDSPMVAVGILVFGILLEGWSFATAVREASVVRGDRTWWEFIRRTKAAELPVVLLEDLGALVGLVLALVGVALVQITGDARWDAIGSIAIGVLLTVIAVILAIEMRSLLVGEAASPAVIEKIRRAVLEGPRVHRIIHMRTTHLGPDQLLLGAKVEFDADLSFSDLAAEIDRAETRVRAAVASVDIIYIEPDVHQQERVA